MRSMRMSMTKAPASAGGAAAFNPSDYGTAKGYWQADDYAAGSAANLVTTGTPYSALSLVSGAVTESPAGWNSVTKTLDIGRLTDARLRATVNGTTSRFVIAQVMDVTSIDQSGIGDPAAAYFVMRYSSDFLFTVIRAQGWFAASNFPWVGYYGYYNALGSPLLTTGRQIWIYNSEPGVEHKLYINGAAVVNANGIPPYADDKTPEQIFVGNAPTGSSSAQFSWKATFVWSALTSSIADINTAISAYYGV